MTWAEQAAVDWAALLAREAAEQTQLTTLQALNIAARLAALEAKVFPPSVLLLNRDLSSGDLLQYTHRDFGLGTDVGGNGSGAGFLYYHPNVAGRPAAGLTVTPTSAAGGIPTSSDAVYLWDPVMSWGTQGNEWWLKTSLFFPSAANMPFVAGTGLFQPGESFFHPTTGEWN